MHLEKIDRLPLADSANLQSRACGRTPSIYANERLLEAIRQDQSLEQAANVAMLPGIVGRALAMPDIHQGYGFPIGGVAAVDEQDGVVSPGGVGFDINCGVRLLEQFAYAQRRQTEAAGFGPSAVSRCSLRHRPDRAASMFPTAI